MIRPTRPVTSQHVREHYQELDELYRKLWGKHLHHGLWENGNESTDEATNALIQKVAESCSISDGDLVCDIGCGYGGTATVLANDFGANITGITITPRQFDLARRLRTKRGTVSFALEDWLENSQPSGHFDHAIAIESSEHAQSKTRFFKQMARVLRPGGSFAICAWTLPEQVSRFASQLLLQPICTEGRLPSLLNVGEYRRHLRIAGLNVTKTENLTARVKHTWDLVINNMARYFARHPCELVRALRTQNRDFFWTPFRMRAAYELGSLQYTLIAGCKLTERSGKEK